MFDSPPEYRRFLPDGNRTYAEWVAGARQHVGTMDTRSADFLHLKPFPHPDAPGGFAHQRSCDAEVYVVLNLLGVLGLSPGSRVLEVGCGPGWVTEILVGLGLAVEAIEPSAEMIAVARQRVDGFSRLRRIRAPSVTFHETTLEECPLPDESVNAVVFFASLHHVVDERRGLAEAYRVLRPGGLLGVDTESAWQPGDRVLEGFLGEEMRRTGTLESPFTQAYLDWLLRHTGFESITRYHSINGFVPVELGDCTVAQMANPPASATNALTARKPGRWPFSEDPNADTRAEISVRDVTRDGDVVHINARVTNVGQSEWLRQAPGRGWVTIALRQGELDQPGMREGVPRHSIERNVAPGESLDLQLTFTLPPGATGVWSLDLVSEWLFWFSHRGTRPASIEI